MQAAHQETQPLLSAEQTYPTGPAPGTQAATTQPISSNLTSAQTTTEQLPPAQLPLYSAPAGQGVPSSAANNANYNPYQQTTPAPPSTSTTPTLPYLPSIYDGVPPRALDPCLDPLPHEMESKKQNDKYQQLARKEQAIQEKKAAKSGFFGKISSMIEETTHAIEKGVTDLDHKTRSEWKNISYVDSERRFRDTFRFPFEERLIDEYWCKSITGNTIVSGYCYISLGYFAFAGTYNGYSIKGFVPLRNILSIQRCVATKPGASAPNMFTSTVLSATQPDTVPTLTILPPANQSYITTTAEGEQAPLPPSGQPRADSLQIYDSEKRVHQIFSFFQLLSFEHCYNTLDHTWRAALQYTGPLPQPIPTNQPFAPYPSGHGQPQQHQ